MNMDKLGTFEKVVIGIITFITLGINGLYLAGPWYIVSRAGVDRPIYGLFQSESVIHAIGIAYILSAAVIFYGMRPGARTLRTLMVGLAVAFCLRFYNFVGLMLTAPLWPPSYTSQFACTILLAVFWVYVRHVSRP